MTKPWGNVFNATAKRPSAWTWVLCLLLVLLLTACRSELFSKLDETDANAVLDVLYSEGISASKVAADGGSWRIEVSGDDYQRALQVTRQQGVPRQRFATMGELFKKEGLISTPSEERLRFIFAVSQELSSTLSEIDGVVSARVHPVIPTNDPLADKVRPASAAVFIKHKADADLQQMAPAIKALVSRSIEGLAVENVSLTFFAVRPSATAATQAVRNAAAPAWWPNSSVVSAALGLVSGLGLTLLALSARQWRRRDRQATPNRSGSPSSTSHAELGAHFDATPFHATTQQSALPPSASAGLAAGTARSAATVTR